MQPYLPEKYICSVFGKTSTTLFFLLFKVLENQLQSYFLNLCIKTDIKQNWFF